MPLSEHEQRMLEQMERALSAEDPKFASALRGSDSRIHYRRRVLFAGLGVFAGMAALIVAVINNLVIVGVLGFLLMLGAVLLAVLSWRSVQAGHVPGPPRSTGPARKRTRRGLLNRLEERWDRRRDNDR